MYSKIVFVALFAYAVAQTTSAPKPVESARNGSETIGDRINRIIDEAMGDAENTVQKATDLGTNAADDGINIGNDAAQRAFNVTDHAVEEVMKPFGDLGDFVSAVVHQALNVARDATAASTSFGQVAADLGIGFGNDAAQFGMRFGNRVADRATNPFRFFGRGRGKEAPEEE